MPELRVISLGALPAHPLWGERAAVRTGHATTTLVRSGDCTLLIDPGLPAQALTARLAERANLGPEAVTHVFFTSFTQDHTRGVEVFADATWWVSRAEREAVGVPMVTALRHALEQGHGEMREALEQRVALLQRCEEAPEQLADGVDLFPLAGVSPGLCGVLIEGERETTLVCGDAVPTLEHLAQRRVLPWAADLELATASFNEALEIADFLVLGRDNITPSPGGADPFAEAPIEDL